VDLALSVLGHQVGLVVCVGTPGGFAQSVPGAPGGLSIVCAGTPGGFSTVCAGTPGGFSIVCAWNTRWNLQSLCWDTPSVVPVNTVCAGTQGGN
jgi:hypothetical protein